MIGESQTNPPEHDWLATTALIAILQAKPHVHSWAEDKAAALEGKNRLEVLRWICCSLDTQHQAIVAGTLGIEVGDLAATARVLQKI